MSATVNVGNGFGRQPKVIGQELIALAALRVTVTNAAQTYRTFLTDDFDDVVGSDAGFAVHRAALQEFIHGVLFQASYEEHAFCTQKPEPGVTDKGLVKDHYGTFGQFQCLGDAAFVSSGVGDGDESRDMTIVVEQSVQLDAALSLTKRGPGKKSQT